MPDTSPSLSLPLLMPSQAQKHITHNEALMQLDRVVQAAVISATDTVPPTTPASGDMYLPAVGATGAWSGQDGVFAVYDGSAWIFVPPKDGWLVYVRDLDALWRYMSGAWAPAPNAATMPLLGINGTADATNRLLVQSTGVLLNHDGSHQRTTINKAGHGDDASVNFQSGFSSRALIGLLGSDDFSVKVSADGISFVDALSVDCTSGAVTLPQTQFPSELCISNRVHCESDNRWVGYQVAYGHQSANLNENLGTGTEPTVMFDAIGPMISAGSTVTGFLLGGRVSNTSVTGFNIRLYFQHGPWTTGWETTAETVRVLLHSEDGIMFDGGKMLRYKAMMSEYTCPDDGVLLLALQPLGSIGSGKYFHQAHTWCLRKTS